MAKTRKKKASVLDASAFDTPWHTLVPRPFHEELQEAYLEYAYSVIYARALPDARDGLKPVHRRILWAMHRMGVGPDKSHTKSARIVGETMGKYHPHGDSAIYETMVRLTQDFSLSFPLVDGKGAFGTNDDGAAASRYTEARLSHAGMLMLDAVDEGTVDMRDNYDQTEKEPRVLPAAFPNALVNGGSGIAVGMSTNMIPHNLGESIAAARHLLAHPDATLKDLMRHIPGPDLPDGGLLLGQDQVLQAYETGRGVVRMRARADITPAGGRGRARIEFSELPYAVGPEKIIDAARKQVAAKRLEALADIRDLTDMSTEGTRLVAECKAGANPDALLALLYKHTPLESSFGIINNVLHQGTPVELGLKPLLQIFLDHRVDVVTRRTQHRLAKAVGRRHLIEGLLVALDNIDLVVRIIRSSDSTAHARGRLVTELAGVKVALGDSSEARDLDDEQAGHILEMPLRRLTNLESSQLRAEWGTLTETINYLKSILDDEATLVGVIDDELAAVAARHATPRRTELVPGTIKDHTSDSNPPLELPDEPCTVAVTTTGRIMRATGALNLKGRHGGIAHHVRTTTRSEIGVVSAGGLLFRKNVFTLPDVGDSSDPGVAASDVVGMGGDCVAGLVTLGEGGPMLAVGTSSGMVKRIEQSQLPARSGQAIIGFRSESDRVVNVGTLPADPDAADLVFVTTAGQLLRTGAAAIRPQGRSGGGVAGVKLPDGMSVVAFAAVPKGKVADTRVLVMTDTGGVKATPLGDYPVKGRATLGVRGVHLRKKDSAIVAALVTTQSPVVFGPSGKPVKLPPSMAGKRDGAPVQAGSGSGALAYRLAG